MLTIYSLLFIIILLAVIIFLLFVFKINIPGYLGTFFNNLLDAIAAHNTRKTVQRIKKEKLEKSKGGYMQKYKLLAENLIRDYNLPLTLDGFNTMLTFIFAVLILACFLFLKNLAMSVLVALSLVVAGFTYFIMHSKMSESSKIENIMEAEDLICPLARDGVMVAIKKVLESREYLNPRIRHCFVQFVDNCDNHGYSFKRAMETLNRQLGPKFDNFAEKAIVFEYNERKGMADIFLDIVDENAAIREINARKNRIFREMNKEFVIKTALV
ncbi:MAG: hypothetical protein N2489_04795, partial [Clostridia bacterium]|nr:hypothetical protein [Clostridia bacterium]